MTPPSSADLLELARRCWPPPNKAYPLGPKGASAEAISAFEDRLQRPLSPELRTWLSVCNGGPIGKHWLYGVGPEAAFGVESTIMLQPDWQRLQWVPITSDGCGSYYLELPHDDDGPLGRIGFIDCMDDQDRVTYYVASRADRFIWFMLRNQLGEDDDRWPFDRDYVLTHDPELAALPPRRQPWNS